MVLARTIYVFIKLLPSILALRKDRVLWISDDRKDIDEERFRKHARRILNTCLALGPVYISSVNGYLQELTFYLNHT